ncbi:hypothetical protein OKA05_01980 [Luteolibacter arcticus]|uniref:Uncharacterized protein n=1 Tax=Luteolibacter arcticus TaxID=1581411 RepID=A0ABT3GCF0_9BACT|nr:hypothetical protein [Luteolibacter arcticus]MCW1921301.1 hypothetical protein [Luteolibacter arcticus]
MTVTEMEQALDAAENELRRADTCADRMARMLKGRLRKVSSGYTLKALKAELANYNAHTGRWKEDK